MTDIVKIDPKEYGLEKIKADEITKGLSQILNEKAILVKRYSEVIKLELTPENVLIFRELRLKIRDNRTKGVEVWRKTKKEYFLRGGQFVDAIGRNESTDNERMEEKLLSGEKYLENLEVEQREKLKVERVALLEPYEVDTSVLDLGRMKDEVWNNYFGGVKLQWQNRIDAEKKAEEERLAKEKAEAVERERIRKENEQLKKEAEEKEKQDKIEQEKRDQIDAARVKREAANQKIREDKEHKEREVHEAQLKKERNERERIENELKAKREAEEKAESARLANIEAELNKGDSEKVKDLIIDLAGLKNKYQFKSKKYQKIYGDVGLLIDKVINHIEK